MEIYLGHHFCCYSGYNKQITNMFWPLTTAQCLYAYQTLCDPAQSSSVFSNPIQCFLQLGQVVVEDGPPASTLTVCVWEYVCVVGS